MIAVAPLLYSLLSAILMLVIGSWRRAPVVSVLLSAGHLALVSVLAWTVLHGAPLALQAGGWVAPFGITFYIDELAAIMLWISSFLAFGVHVYSLGSNEGFENRMGFHTLYHFQMVGVCGAFSTNDLFNLYVWFEVLLLASFALMASRGTRQAIAGTTMYVVINLLGSALFLFGLALLYSSTGTLNFADLQRLQAEGPLPPMTSIVAALLFLAFTIKAGVVPFAHWLPASYPAASIGSLALFAGLLTKVGVYTLMRFVAAGVGRESPELLSLLGWLSLATMLIGVLGAASSKSLRHILSYHIISQVGYMTLAVSLGTPAALAAATFYLVHHMVVKTSLFLVTGIIEKRYGSSRLEALGDLSRMSALLVFLFAIPALSLAGVPPLSGFWAKLLVLREALALGDITSMLFVLIVGLLTLFSMSKIWSEAFQKSADPKLEVAPVSKAANLSMVMPLLLFCAWIIALGLVPAPFVRLSERAAASLLNSSLNIDAVLGASAAHEEER